MKYLFEDDGAWWFSFILPQCINVHSPVRTYFIDPSSLDPNDCLFIIRNCSKYDPIKI